MIVFLLNSSRRNEDIYMICEKKRMIFVATGSECSLFAGSIRAFDICETFLPR